MPRYNMIMEIDHADLAVLIKTEILLSLHESHVSITNVVVTEHPDYTDKLLVTYEVNDA